MNPKWLGFMIFVWLFGVFIGATYEKDWSSATASLSGSTDNPSTVEILFSPSEYTWEGSSGEVSWWSPRSGYWDAVIEVLVWDFPFCKPYDADLSGVIEADEQGNNDIGKYAGYFLKAFGIVGLAALMFAMFEFFQGILPW